jgi:thioredoxin reductase
MNRFKEKEPTARRPLITAARHRGTMPSDVFRRIRKLIREGRLTWLEGDLSRAATEKGKIRIGTGNRLLEADRLILATGFTATPPGKPLPDGSAGPNLYCAVIVKRVDARTRAKTSINELLRD